MSEGDDDLELDHERFIYDEIYEFGSYEPTHVRVGCHHRNVEDVRNILTNAVMARLCLDCNTQLPIIGRIEW